MEVRMHVQSIPPLTDSAIRRFWALVNKNGPTPLCHPELGPCWLWTGGCTTKGYGTFWSGGSRSEGRHLLAHRAALAIARSGLPADVLTLHRCDNPPCVRDSHLFDGTHSDNAIDAVQKGRARGLLPRGEANAKAVLTESDVFAIRRLLREGESLRGAARLYGVSYGTVQAISNGRSWRWLQ